jgi:hypothetical protein
MGHSIQLQPTGVEFSPPDLVRRRLATRAGLQGDTVEITRLERRIWRKVAVSCSDCFGEGRTHRWRNRD